MKLYATLSWFTIGFIFSQCTAPEIQAPDNVLSQFSTMFPEARNVVWVKDGEDWEAEFEMNEMEISAEFSNNGKWIETETELDLSELPFAALDSIHEKFKECDISELEELRTPNFMAYEVELTCDDKEYEILISGSGQIIENEEDSEDTHSDEVEESEIQESSTTEEEIS